MPELTWEQVLERKEDLVGGDIETHEGDYVYRGPIRKIEDVGENMISFESPWMARMYLEGADKVWKKWHITSMFIDKTQSKPQEIGGGRISLVIPYIGSFVIYPNRGSKLDPKKVEGLIL